MFIILTTGIKYTCEDEVHRDQIIALLQLLGQPYELQV